MLPNLSVEIFELSHSFGYCPKAEAGSLHKIQAENNSIQNPFGLEFGHLALPIRLFSSVGSGRFKFRKLNNYGCLNLLNRG